MKELIHFLDWLDQNPRGGAVYRGHANESWLLVPSAFRVGNAGIVDRNGLLAWRNAAGRFAQPRPQNDLEWLVLAQHYGIATGLLDWTTNPLVALYFACSDASGSDGCVIQCDRSNFQSFNKPETVDVFLTRERPALINASDMNARTLAQDSMMSLHYGCFPTFGISGASESYRVEIDKKFEILMSLRRIGFTTERLHSDIITAAQEFKRTLATADILKRVVSLSQPID